MLVLVAAIIGLLTVPLLGGRLLGLADVRLRRTWILPLALGLQIVVITVVPEADGRVLAGVHIGTYVLAGVFVFWNRAVPGLITLGIGAACNGVTIAVNGGMLPASPTALARSGWVNDVGEFTNSGVVSDPLLPLLGDVFWLPAGWPLANVFSVGDILIVAGVVLMGHAYGGTRERRQERAHRRAGSQSVAAPVTPLTSGVPAPRAAVSVGQTGVRTS